MPATMHLQGPPLQWPNPAPEKRRRAPDFSGALLDVRCGQRLCCTRRIDVRQFTCGWMMLTSRDGPRPSRILLPLGWGGKAE